MYSKHDVGLDEMRVKKMGVVSRRERPRDKLNHHPPLNCEDIQTVLAKQASLLVRLRSLQRFCDVACFLLFTMYTLVRTRFRAEHPARGAQHLPHWLPPIASLFAAAWIHIFEVAA